MFLVGTTQPNNTRRWVVDHEGQGDYEIFCQPPSYEPSSALFVHFVSPRSLLVCSRPISPFSFASLLAEHVLPKLDYPPIQIMMRAAFLVAVVLAIYGGAEALSTVKPTSSRQSTQLSRVDVLRTGFFAATALLVGPSPAAAADQKTIYLSGKAPKVPGAKPKDKNDTSGTRKDPNFLRSIADCRSQCEAKSSQEGSFKTKEDCLSECQDICCTTYEQCTFNIVPRM